MNHTNERNSKSTLARSLGCQALGLGAAVLLTSRRVARLFGLKTSGRKIKLFRKDGSKTRLQGMIAGVAGVVALDLAGRGIAASGRRSSKKDKRPALRAAITVARTPADVYAFWRNVENFPRFVRHLESVTSPDKIRSRWQAKLAGKTVIEWDATIVEDTPDQRLVWKVQSPTGRLLVDTVEARFELALDGHATEVHVVLYGSQLEKPGRTVRWLHKLPEGLLFDPLHRFKQLVELGEISLSDSSIHQEAYPARPSPHGEPIPAFEAAPTDPNLALGASS
jgi:uncharacterized membrane protein